ncbi:MAG: hypothetical protein CLLPBCKN_008577 [Chroococcidiopsis cubana SAG 39.79]|nr:hypothetical protein [Chroococcidiopsis cubana SAG 39.79]
MNIYVRLKDSYFLDTFAAINTVTLTGIGLQLICSECGLICSECGLFAAIVV